MKVGVLKEIKTKENRVSMTPAGVEQMLARGHSVQIETTAGEGSGFSDDAYVAAGATIAIQELDRQPAAPGRPGAAFCVRKW